MAMSTTRGRPRAVVVIALFAGLAGCKSEQAGSECEDQCRKEAACKLEAQQGERMLGERSMPPDPGCMSRCTNDPEAFAKCEGKKKECAGILACTGGR